MLNLKYAIWFSSILALATGCIQAQQRKPVSEQEFQQLIETPKTPEVHQRLAEHYEAHAARLEAEAEKHEASAASYRAYARTGGASPKGAAIAASWRNAEHCDKLADKLRRAAQKERALANEHRGLASTAQRE